MKKIFLVTLALSLLLAFVPVQADPLITGEVEISAQVTYTGNSLSPGTYVDVHIYLDQNPGLFFIGLTLSFDGAVLERLAADGTAVAQPGPFTLPVLESNLNATTFVLNFEADDIDDYDFTGRIATIPFRVRDNADLGDSDITLGTSFAGIMNTDMEFFDAELTDATFTVVDRVLLWGDLNSDGVVNAADLLLMRQHLASITPSVPVDLDVADLDGNDTIDFADLMLLRMFLAELITYFPVEVQ